MIQTSARCTTAVLFALLTAASMVKNVSAHGYMSKPVTRNWLFAHSRGFYNEMSLNRPGTGTYCGGQFERDNRFAAGGQFATRQITGHYTEGGVIHTETHIKVNHWGYIELRLCPLSNPSTSAEQAQLSESCLRKYRLKPLNGRGTGYLHWINHGAGGSEFREKVSWRLPRGVKCERCVLQWRWVTAHMCRLPGADPRFVDTYTPRAIDKFRINRCPKDYLSYNKNYSPEKFYNCADIKIRPARG